MKHLLHRGRLKQALEIRRLGLAQANADAGHTVFGVGDLNQAKPITPMDQPHRFGINGKPRGLQIALRPSCIEVAIKDGEFRWG